MEHKINVIVMGKIAVAEQVEYICGNKDYVLCFGFDEEWSEHEYKTARFIYNGKHIDVPFSGNKCKVPQMSDTHNIKVGVYAGDLVTTVPAHISAKKSILCGNPAPADPTPDVYHQIMAMLNDLKEVSQEEMEQAVRDYLTENPIDELTSDSIAEALGYTPERELVMGAATVTGDGNLVIEVPEGTAIKTGTQICYRDPAVTENAFAEIASNDATINGKSYRFATADNRTFDVNDVKELHEKNDTIIIRIDETVGEPLFAQVIAVVPKEQDAVEVTAESITAALGYTPANKAVLYDKKQTLTEAEKAQARENIGITTDEVATATKFFDISLDGIVSLKPEYRGNPTSTEFPYAVSDNGVGKDGSKFNELPEKIVIPSVIDGVEVTGFQPGMFYYNYRVKEIVFPNCVTELPASFCRNARYLASIKNTEHIASLGQRVFMNTRIDKALFPSLTSADERAFLGCYLLHTADIGNTITAIPESFFSHVL